MHFTLKNGVAIYGGFEGKEDPATFNLDNRNFENNETILSGHFWDPKTPPALHFHTYHVVYHPQGTDLDETAVLDGFTISGGKADGTYPHNRGGGMFNYQSSPVLRNSTFHGNNASLSGGGISNEDCSPTILNCTFHSNSAQNGGAIRNAYSQPLIINSTFSGNIATETAGGIYNSYSNLEILNCTFFQNSDPAIFNSNFSPIIRNSIIFDNSRNIVNDELASPDVSFSLIGKRGDLVYPGEGNINADPLLEPLSHNGGATLTHAIPRNSPAYAIPKDAGDGNWNGAPDTDQRGVRRAMTGFRAIGAYEDSRLVQPGVLMLLLDDE